VALFTIAVIVLSAAVGRRFKLEEDILTMLPDSDPVVQDFRLVVKSFKALDALYIDIGADDKADPSEEQIIAVADALYETLAQSEMFTCIDYRFSSELLMNFYDSISRNLASVISSDDLSDLAVKLTPEEIDNRLSAAKRSLVEPSGTFLRRYITSDPLNFGGIVLSKLEQLNSGAQQAQLVDGRIWSGDLKHVLMIAVPNFPATDSKRGKDLILFLDDARSRASQLAPQETVRISYVGGHRATLDNAETIKSDIKRATTAASIGIAALAVISVRRKLYALLIFVPMVFGIACASIVFAVFQPTISAIAVGCAIVLVGIVVDYGIYFLYRWDNIDDASVTPRACVRSMYSPLLMSAGTTAAGLLCLLLSSLPGQRQMGAFGALAVLSSLLFVLLFLPHLVSYQQQQKTALSVPLVHYCERLLAWRLRRGRLFGILTAVVLLAGIIGLGRLRFEGDPQKLNCLSPASLKDEKRVLDTWGDFSATTVVVRAGKLEDALQKNDRLAERLKQLQTADSISSFSSVSAILPSVEAQLKNQERWRSFWKNEKGTEILTQVRGKAAELGFNPDAFEPFFKKLDGQCDVVKPETFTDCGLDRLMRSYVARSDDEFLIMSSFFPKNYDDLRRITSLIVSDDAGAIVTNKKSFVEYMTTLVRAETVNLGVYVSVAIVLILFLFLVRVELVLSVILPLCFGLLITFGALGFLNIPVNLISCLFIVLIFGAGPDYSIFLISSALDRYRGRGEHLAVTLGSVIICLLTVLCSFGALALSKHPGLFSFGATGFVGMASCLAAAILVVPMISNYLLPADSKHGAPTLRTTAALIWSGLYLGGAGLLYICIARHWAMIRYFKKPLQRQRFVRRYIHLVAYGLVRFFPFPGTRGLFLNADRQSFSKPAVIISNHVSALDIMAILALPADMVMMVKRWVWRAPVMGLIIRDAGYIPVDDYDAQSIIAQGAKCIEQGVSVMGFPEGTRSRDGKMQRFHKGAFELAAQICCDVVPVLISGTQSCLAPQTYWIGYCRAVVHVLPRITPRDFDYKLGGRALLHEVKNRMLGLVNDDWRLAQNCNVFLRNIRSLYDYSGAYVETYVKWKLRLDPIYRHIDELVPQTGPVLDLGCGYGLITHILARKSLERSITGVDFDARKIRVAQQTVGLNGNISFELHDLLEWDYPQVDTIILVDVLHYWCEDKQRMILSKVSKCLRPGGILIFRDGLASPALNHRLVRWSERFSCIVGQNRAGDGLFFGDREFYVTTLERQGLRLTGELSKWGRGSNTVMIFKKGL